MNTIQIVIIGSAREYTNKKGEKTVRGEMITSGGTMDYSAPIDMLSHLEFGKKVEVELDIKSYTDQKTGKKSVYIKFVKIIK